MAKSKKTSSECHRGDSMKRKNRIVLTLNDKEKIFLDRFCNKYKIQNRSKLLRETIMSVFLKKLDEDYPTLWGDKE